MQTESFTLKDRFSPEGDNDEREAIKLGNAVDPLVGRRPDPTRAVGRVDQAQITAATRQYQTARGLKVDGLVRPKGPTAQRIAAETLQRDRASTPPRHIRALGRGANAPLTASVGPGRSNLAGDVQTLQAGLTVTGHKPGPVRPYHASEDDEDGAASIQSAVRTFQRQHGLKVDGVVEPYGPTHDMLDTVLGPHLQQLVGDDPVEPRPWQPVEPEIVARNVPFRPTTIRTRFQDPEDLPTRPEYDAAVRLGRRIADDEYLFALDVGPDDDDVVQGGAGDETLGGGAGDDDLDMERPQIAKAEQRLKSRARALRSPAASGKAAQEALQGRVDAARDNLIDVYQADGMGPTDAARAVETYLQEVAPNNLGDFAIEVMGFVPGVGEVLSAVEAAKLSQKMAQAEADGDTDRVKTLKAEYLLAAAGTIPIIGKAAKFGRTFDALISHLPPLERQIYRRKLSKAEKRFDENIDGFSIQKEMGEERWAELSPATRKSLTSIVNNRKGAAGEAMVKNWLDLAKLNRPLRNSSALRRYEITDGPNESVTSHLDEVTTQHFQSTFGGLFLKRKEGGVGWETKVDNGTLSVNQKKFNEISKDADASVTGEPRKKDPQDLPEIDKQIRKLRVPLSEVDETEFKRLVRDSIAEENRHGAELIDEVEGLISDFFEASRKAKADDDTSMLEATTVALVLLSVSAAVSQPEKDQGR